MSIARRSGPAFTTFSGRACLTSSRRPRRSRRGQAIDEDPVEPTDILLIESAKELLLDRRHALWVDASRGSFPRPSLHQACRAGTRSPPLCEDLQVELRESAKPQIEGAEPVPSGNRKGGQVCVGPGRRSPRQGG